MQTLNISATEDTPEITFNGEANEFLISGRSLPEDVTTFYKPVFEWLEVFSDTDTPTTTFKFKLEYFNTASSKIILDILMKLEDMMEAKQSKLKIEWYYFESDDDMLEAGEEYKELVEIPFHLISC
ncbi:nuclear pore complex subunit [Sphingobacteriaceae bacterium]|nr:nuclear pore complex subunit [Sphingobacteriaceae bacterium]